MSPSPQPLPALTVNPDADPIVSPRTLRVPFAGTGDLITVTWNAVGCKLTSVVGLPFAIKVSPDGTTATGQYTAPETPTPWNYTVHYVINKTGAPASHDPEIDNIKP